jgi:hypothetical protein
MRGIRPAIKVNRIGLAPLEIRTMSYYLSKRPYFSGHPETCTCVDCERTRERNWRTHREEQQE